MAQEGAPLTPRPCTGVKRIRDQGRDLSRALDTTAACDSLGNAP